MRNIDRRNFIRGALATAAAGPQRIDAIAFITERVAQLWGAQIDAYLMAQAGELFADARVALPLTNTFRFLSDGD